LPVHFGGIVRKVERWVEIRRRYGEVAVDRAYVSVSLGRWQMIACRGQRATRFRDAWRA
jgi:hypothetical protein